MPSPFLAGHALLVTRLYPYPPHDGALQYSSQLIDALSRCVDRLDVICATEAGRVPAQPEGLPDSVQFHTYPARQPSLTSRVLTLAPNSSLRFITDQAKAILRDCLAERPELVVIDHVGATWAASEVSRDQALIYCTHNNECLTRLSIFRHSRNFLVGAPHLVDAARLFMRDRRLLGRARVTTVISKQDRSTHERLFGVDRCIHLPPAYSGAITAPRTIDATTPRQVCIIGSFDWQAKRNNLLAFLANNAQPIRAAGAELVIAGRGEASFLDHLRSSYPWLQVLGEVDDIGAVLERSRLGILQGMAGGGFRMTALTYVFGGCPILSRSDLVADLDFRPEIDFLCCEDEKSIHAVVKQIIDDFPRLNEIQKSARRKCREFASPDRLRALMADVVSTALGAR